MFPSEQDVKNQLISYINDYLKHTNLSFTDLKKLITDKKIIDSIHAKLVDFLYAKKNERQQIVKKNHEELAWENQCKEDKQQSEADSIEQLRDNDDYNAYKRNWDRNRNDCTDLENKCGLMIEQIGDIKSQIPPGSLHLQVNNFKELSVIGAAPSLPPYAVNQVNANTRLINHYRQIITRLTADNTRISAKFEEITKRAQARKEREKERNERQTARNNYKINKYGLQKTLTQQRQNQLSKSIDEQCQIIEHEYADLINNSLIIHFPLLLQQLKSNQPPIKANEQEALTIIIGLMEQHLQHEYNYALHSARLTQEAETLLSDEQKLEQIRKDIDVIEQIISPLTKQNSDINSNSKALSIQYEYCVNLSKNLNYSTLLFLSLTFLTLIPMFLFYGGIIVITPSFLLTAPPLLLGLTTVATSIMSSVYSSKAKAILVNNRENTFTLKSNEETIQTYTNMLKKANSITIPKLDKKIELAKQTQQRLQDQCIKDKQLADDTLNQIQLTFPISFAQSSFHRKPSSTSSTNQSSSSTHTATTTP